MRLYTDENPAYRNPPSLLDQHFAQVLLSSDPCNPWEWFIDWRLKLHRFAQSSTPTCGFSTHKPHLGVLTAP